MQFLLRDFYQQVLFAGYTAQIAPPAPPPPDTSWFSLLLHLGLLGLIAMGAVCAFRAIRNQLMVALQQSNPEQIQRKKMIILGKCLLWSGIFFAAYFLFIYNTTVDTGIGSLHNVGLMQNRLLGCIGGIAAAIVGAIILTMNSRQK